MAHRGIGARCEGTAFLDEKEQCREDGVTGMPVREGLPKQGLVKVKGSAIRR